VISVGLGKVSVIEIPKCHSNSLKPVPHSGCGTEKLGNDSGTQIIIEHVGLGLTIKEG